MKLNITNLHDTALDCFQDALVTLSSWWKRESDLMFIQSWDFMLKKGASEDTLGSRIVAKERNIELPLMEKYHGVSSFLHTTSDYDEIVSIVKNELLKGQPTLLHIDSYWCPSDPAYQSRHLTHYCMAVGFDENKSSLIISDPFYQKKDLNLHTSHIKEGCKGCITFEHSSEFKDEYNWREILETSISRIRGDGVKPSIFESMRKFAEELEKSLDLEKEFASNSDALLDAPLSANLYDVSRCRRQFCKSLSFIARKCDVGDLAVFYEKFEKASYRWTAIKGLLVKAYFAQDLNSMLNKITNKVIEVADEEEKIAFELLECCKKGTFSVCQISEEILKEQAVKDYIYLDISRHFNNTSFWCYGLGYSELSQNSIEEGYFDIEYLPGELWNAGDMRFTTKPPQNGAPDNVSCRGQKISVQEDCYSGIMLLGWSEFGNHSEYLEIEYKDGSFKKLPLAFSDWSLERPVFKETIAWTGNGLVRKKGKIEVFSSSVKIYAIKIGFAQRDNLKTVKLPECPNIHILAATLYKDSEI